MTIRLACIGTLLLAACLSRPALSDEASQNKVGHAHTCRKYLPKEASETGTQGTTQMAFRIMTDGNTQDVHVESSSGDSKLDQAAVQCAQRWHYLPAKRDGVPIEFDWKAKVVWVIVERPLDSPDGPSKPCIDQYPKEAASPGVHGTTKLTIQVAADGSLKDATVLDTSGSKDLDDLAAVCVKKWQLNPEQEETTKTAYVSWTIPYYGK